MEWAAIRKALSRPPVPSRKLSTTAMPQLCFENTKDGAGPCSCLAAALETIALFTAHLGCRVSWLHPNCLGPQDDSMCRATQQKIPAGSHSGILEFTGTNSGTRKLSCTHGRFGARAGVHGRCRHHQKQAVTMPSLCEPLPGTRLSSPRSLIRDFAMLHCLSRCRCEFKP